MYNYNILSKNTIESIKYKAVKDSATDTIIDCLEMQVKHC